jgi:hypothetical protein
MEIKIDEMMVQQVLDEQTQAGVKAAMGGYAIRSAIEKTVGESILPQLLGEAVVKAAEQIDIDNLTHHLAEEIARSTTKTVVTLIRDAMIEMILDMRKVASYDHKAREAEREKLTATLFR